MNRETIDNAADMAALMGDSSEPTRGALRPLAGLLCTVAAGGLITYMASSDMFLPALKVMGYAAASAAAIGMVATQRGPLHWLTWASIQAQAICLGIREEIAVAVRSGLAEHAERVRRIKARYE